MPRNRSRKVNSTLCSQPHAKRAASRLAARLYESVSSCLRLLEDVHGAGAAHADDMGEADLGALDLAVLRFAAKMRGHFIDVGDARGAERVAFRQKTAG